MEDLDDSSKKIPSSYSVLSTTLDLCPYSIPSWTKYQSLPLTILPKRKKFKKKLPDNHNKEVRKCIAMLIDDAPLMTTWGFLHLLSRIVPFVEYSDLPKDIFKHNFWRLSMAHNPILFQSVLLLKANFPELFSANESMVLLHQMFGMLDDLGM